MELNNFSSGATAWWDEFVFSDAVTVSLASSSRIVEFIDFGNVLEQSISVSSSQLQVTEGSENSFEVSLSTDPGDATITLSLEQTAGYDPLTASTSRPLVFDQSNWNQPVTVTLTAIEDEDSLDESAEFVLSVVGGNGEWQDAVVEVETRDNDRGFDFSLDRGNGSWHWLGVVDSAGGRNRELLDPSAGQARVGRRRVHDR